MKEKYNIAVLKTGKVIQGWLLNGKEYIIPKTENLETYKTEFLTTWKLMAKDQESPEQFKEYYFNNNHREIDLKDYRVNKVKERLKKELEKREIKSSYTKVYHGAEQICREAILTGTQIKMKHSEYSQNGELYATQDIGKNRTNQEDSVLIIEHPQNKNFKLLAVADGIGGNEDGEKASRHVVAKLIEWFENLNKNLDTNMQEVEIELNRLLPNILNDIKLSKGAGSTLSAVIIGKEETLISNIGDSRVYSMKDGNLKQETKDDSIAQELLEKKSIPNEELTRYSTQGNVITNSINEMGLRKAPNMYIIQNKSYDRIMAVSDGVSDCLSKQEIETIMKNSEKELLTHNIVSNALNNHSNLSKTINNLPEREKVKSVKSINNNPRAYISSIIGGKDNTTAAAYIKK